MNRNKVVRLISQAFVLLSALSLLSVSLMAFHNPQQVMDLVGVKLNNADAFSSIRGVYGGVGLTIFISLIHLMRKHLQLALIFLSLLWGFYALSRAITIMVEGPLGDFGMQWIITEMVLFSVAVVLLLINRTQHNTI